MLKQLQRKDLVDTDLQKARSTCGSEFRGSQNGAEWDTEFTGIGVLYCDLRMRMPRGAPNTPVDWQSSE